ncbi:hypothetical protein [Streptomyces sp. TLI_185]|uniref:hypothetical protein n=1 Tax=Streptomyces sp. TLI_185 TaxID=2485151 RepID=UPI000F4E7CD4|nr:hypothetical protein [Streptomyces sp. TLI_185]
MQSVTTKTETGHHLQVDTERDASGNVVQTTYTEHWKADGVTHHTVDVQDAQSNPIRESRETWDYQQQPDNTYIYNHRTTSNVFTDAGELHTESTETTSYDTMHRATTTIDTKQDLLGGDTFTTTTTINGADRETVGKIEHDDQSWVEITQSAHGNTVEQHTTGFDAQGQELIKSDSTAWSSSESDGTRTGSETTWTNASGESVTQRQEEFNGTDGTYSRNWETNQTDTNGDTTTTRGWTVADADHNETTWVREAPDGSSTVSTTKVDGEGKGTETVTEVDKEGNPTSETTRPVTKDDGAGESSLPAGNDSDFPEPSHPRPGLGLITTIDDGTSGTDFPPEWGIAKAATAGGPRDSASVSPYLTNLTGQGTIANAHVGRLGWESGPSQPGLDWDSVETRVGVADAIRATIAAASSQGWLTSNRFDSREVAFHSISTDGDAPWGELTTPEGIISTSARIGAEVLQLQSVRSLESGKDFNLG